MNIGTVMDELGVALGTITGLRVFPYSASRVVPPAAIVGWPDPVTYDSTLRRGADELTLPVWVLVGSVDARTARDVLAGYLDGAAAGSVKAALDGDTYTACDSVRVASATVESISSAGVEYLGAVFQVEITGSGS